MECSDDVIRHNKNTQTASHPRPPHPKHTHTHTRPPTSLLVTHSWAGGGLSSISGPTEGGINKEEEEEGGGKSWKRYESRSKRGGDCSGGEREGEREG